eukprot:6153589-Prymnesium_polylepis.1
MGTLDREESGLKLVHGIAMVSRSQAGRRAVLAQTRIAGERRRSPNLYYFIRSVLLVTSQCVSHTE